jgi:hypothetical protein
MACGRAAAKAAFNGHQWQNVDNRSRLDPPRQRLTDVWEWRQCHRSRSLSRRATVTGADARCARAAELRGREAHPNPGDASESAEHRTPPQLMPIVSHSTIVSRERIATLIGSFVRMFGSRRISLEFAARASGSRTSIVILHILLQFAMLLCRKLFAIGAY